MKIRFPRLTLIEWMVVVSIIALVVGMMLPQKPGKIRDNPAATSGR